MSDVTGKSAIVTGGGRGIGAAIARALAAHGAKVVLAARSRREIDAVAGEIAAGGGKAIAVECDVADWASVQKLVAAAEKQFGPTDILINNAGVIDPIAALAESDPAAWARNIAINLSGAYYVIRALLPGMLARKSGVIVNVSSGAAHRALEGWSAYCAGKAGLAMLTNSLALETKGSGLRVFGFSPGTVDTEMQVKIRASGINMVSRIPRADLTPADHPARGLLYLCGAAAADLSGSEVSLRDPAFRARIGLS
jgi:NAD(P)-dependent dehydrogenase (short-subunit alcohol dehydrogenase family)